jgi:ankyrin repeat protein
LDQVRTMLAARPELAGMDLGEGDEHRALHFAAYRRDVPMVRVLMQAGADARKGIWPHRDATSALAIARDRGYGEVSDAIEDEEDRRQRELSCPNTMISPAQDEISAAIARGDAAGAMESLEAEPALIHACDRSGATPLHVAAEELQVRLVGWLLERKASPRKKDLDGLTPIDRAALAVDPRGADEGERFGAVARLLVEHGAEVTARAAVALGDGAWVRELLAAEPGRLREIGSGGGLLTLAVKHGRLEMARLLLELGADVDERIVLENVEEPTPSWGMPLWWAALAGNLEMTRLLLDRGADPNANVYASGWPLRNGWQFEPVRRLLLDRGAKPQPYMLAEFHDVAGAHRLLAEAGEEMAGALAWSAADFGCAEIVEMALPRLAWAKDDRRWHWVIIQPIRGAGADSAANEGHFRAMAAILRYGVDPNVPRFGATALHFAAAHHGRVPDADRARFAAMLVDHGARLDLRDEILHSTPLAWAARWGQVALARTLIERGAPIEEPDAEPWATPRAWAEKMGHPAISELLSERRGR